MGLTKTEWHTLSCVDLEAGLAFCSLCDDIVEIKHNGTGMRCQNKLRATSKRREKTRRAKNIKNAPEQLDEACSICGRRERLCLDHDHETMEYRGTLCHWCNIAIGLFGDNPDLLKKAIDYLSR